MSKNIYKNKSSIAFVGSKWRYRNKIFDIIINEFKDNLNDKFLIIDLFGGSGSLTIIFKEIFKNSIFVLNDYDEIITDKENKNKIDNTITRFNEIKNEILNNIDIENLKNKKIKLNQENKNKTYIVLNKYEKEINENIQLKKLLSSNLCFNSRMLNFDKKPDIFNRLNKSDNKLYYENFKDVEIIHNDFKNILNNINELKNKYDIKDDKHVLLLLDPPYLYFDMSLTYHVECWAFQNYLNLLKVFINNYNIILFEDKKNALGDIIDFMSDLLNINIKYKIFDLSKTKQENKVRDQMIIKN